MKNPNLPSTVGVLGGGRMGAGIAHAFLLNGANVLVVERDEESAEAARERVESAAAKSIERGATDANLDEMVSRLAVTVDYDDFKDRQLVVEAVPEDWDLKVTALRGIEARLAEDAFLASNTSSLSVNGLARELKRPQNFLGLHFFNPVPASTLIEVVLGEQTSPDAAAAAKKWVEALGKTAVVVNDAPGFASSRLGVAIALEAMRMVEEGVASAEDIDQGMKLGCSHPMGPLTLADLVGLDTLLSILDVFYRDTGDSKYRAPLLLREMVTAGHLGRKSGRGFYDYSKK